MIITININWPRTIRLVILAALLFGIYLTWPAEFTPNLVSPRASLVTLFLCAVWALYGPWDSGDDDIVLMSCDLQGRMSGYDFHAVLSALLVFCVSGIAMAAHNAWVETIDDVAVRNTAGAVGVIYGVLAIIGAAIHGGGALHRAGKRK